MKTRRTWRSPVNPQPSGQGERVGRWLAVTAGSLRGRRGWAVGSAAVIVLGLLGVWLFVPGGESGPPDPRARQYKDVDACLLTGEKGVAAGTPAAPVWAEMQKASLETRARVNYVPVMGPQTVENAQPYLNSLIQRRCAVVLAVGAPQVGVVESAAKQHPDVRFVVIGDASPGGDRRAENLTVAKSGAELGSSVADVIKGAVEESDSR
ncbi:BMP family ABC transporter substrate-binding protein [Streptomyces sp. NPDC059165]|uniref:BMP family ABC transporter substrate-binding protein n=1 Tax=Streptomyces sp. NPDC059165 TaxID=3346751 RepID=UPI003681E0CA